MTVYTCDGCKHTQTYELNAVPPGWYEVTTSQLRDDTARRVDLCTGCFAGVDWIVRFQGITVPPKVITEPAPLRNKRASAHTAALNNSAALHEWASELGLPPAEHWVEPLRVELNRDLNRPDRATGIARGSWPAVGRVEEIPSEDGGVFVTHLVLDVMPDGSVFRVDALNDATTPLRERASE